MRSGAVEVEQPNQSWIGTRDPRKLRSLMESFGVVGLNWRQGGPNALARFTLPVETRGAEVQRLASAIGVRELVYLATCNRVEIVFATEGDVPVSEYRRRIHHALVGEAGDAARELRAWHGEGAVEHLFLVTCGLDSARLGETEILGQVRDALDLARSEGLVHGRLELLFEEGLKLARKARNEFGGGRTSLAEIGLDRVREHLGNSPAPIALVGVSPMTERCARSLREEGHELWIVNRSEERARELAERLGAGTRSTSLSHFLEQPPAVTALISATGANGPLFGVEELRMLQSSSAASTPLLCIDFATDPDIDPEAARQLDCLRFGMEEILAVAEANREQRLNESGDVREQVDQALTHLGERLARRRADRSIGALHDSYVATASKQVEKLISKHFSDLDEERRELLQRFATHLARHFAHLPASGLRQLAGAHGPAIVQEFFERADPQLEQRLNAALEESQLYAKLPAPGEGGEAISGEQSEGRA